MNRHLQKSDDRATGWVSCFVTRQRSPHIRRASFLIMLLWVFSNVPSSAVVLDGEDVEYPAKLAFLFNFAKFIEWPPGSYRSPSAPLIICIAGHDPFSPGTENELRTRTVLSHPIEIRTLRATDTLSVCSMVFIPVTEKDQADKILERLRGSSTLTVGEIEGFAARGGIINLTVEGRRLHFEINQLAAERAGLKISSKLFSLAKIVTDDQRRPR
jgi:hypothetical protein